MNKEDDNSPKMICGCIHDTMIDKKKKFVFATTLGSVLALIGIILATSANFAFDLLLRTQMVLKPTSGNYPFWKELPVPIKTSMFVFNVTNAERFLNGTEQPTLQELGPYVFNEYHQKTGIIWNDNGTVTYKQIRTFQFIESESNGSLSDKAVVLNVPAATVGATAARLPRITRGLINLGLRPLGEKLFVEKSVREILFDGYDDPILDAAEFIHKFNIPIPGIMDKFGLYYGRNGSDWWDGVFNMYTGTTNLHRMGEIVSWNYSSHMEYFPGPCGDVKGVGDFFPPYMPDSPIYLFSNDLCRAIELKHDSWTYVKAIAGKKYRVDASFFANSTDNPGNYCFEKPGAPLPSGIYNASACRFGAPIFMSQPHFYQADSSYISQFSKGSLKPDRSLHETQFVVESQTGIPLSIVARFQVNAMIENIPEISLFSKIPQRTFFPVAWFETKFEIAESLAPRIWFLSHLYIIMVLVGLLVGAGGVGIAFGSGILYSMEKNSNNSSGEHYRPIMAEEETSVASTEETRELE